MSTLLLPMIRDNAYGQLDTMVPILEAGRLDAAGTMAELIVQQYAVAGICDLLHDGSARGFLTGLQKSAAAFVHLLPKLDRSRLTASRSPAYFAAVACGDDNSARAIAQSLPAEWNRDYEHEDDFLYARFLIELYSLGASANRLREIAARLAAVTDGEDSARRDICNGLLARDASLFETGLEGLIVERRDLFAEAKDADAIPESEWATEGQVFVEGIALVKLARKLGLATQAEYLFVPSLVLGKDVESPSPDSWRRVRN